MISTLNKICFRRANRGKTYTLRSSQLCWEASSFQAMGWGTEDTYKDSFAFALLTREIKEMTNVLPADVLEHPRKNRPLCQKHLIWMTGLAGKNVLPWKITEYSA